MEDEVVHPGDSNLDEGQDSNLDNGPSNEELSKAKEIAENQRIRAEKAEKRLKELEAATKPAETTTPKNETNLSPKDYLALTENKVSSEDFDEVVRLSTVLGKSIADTLKDKTAGAILQTRQEERKSAEVANTAPSRRSSSRDTDKAVLEDLSKGIVPDTEEGIRKLVAAQLAQRKPQAKRGN